MNKYALLVIDVQNYFFDKVSPAHLPDSGKILPRINSLIKYAQNKKWPIIYTNHTAPSKPGNLMAERWDHLPSGWEIKLYGKLNIVSASYKIKKEYYSAFFETRLDDILKREKINHLVLCGVMTHMCVDTTARHGFIMGYQSTVISDACCSKSAGYHQAAILALKHGFSRVMTIKKMQRVISNENI